MQNLATQKTYMWLRDNLGGLKFRRILLYYRMNARRSTYIVVFLVEDDLLKSSVVGIFVT